jgi:hypothetical protein
MARISFTSETEEIIGRLGGNVFQDSYFGIQLRGLAKPRNPQTQLQQLRRGDFGFLSASWRYLTTLERSSWSDAAGTVPAGKRLFIGNNINLILAGFNVITTFVDNTAPVAVPLVIDTLATDSFTVVASGSPSTVPTDQVTILYATDSKEPTLTFTNPAEYQPIHNFSAGTDLSTPAEVISFWNAKYGILVEAKYLCIKSATIDTTNGNRADSAPNCSTVSPASGNFIIDNLADFLVDNIGNFIVYA